MNLYLWLVAIDVGFLTLPAIGVILYHRLRYGARIVGKWGL